MTARRVCSTPGCPTLVDRGHCPTHTRPGPRQRGYDRTHDKLRAQWATHVTAGHATCWRCGQHIHPHTAWDLGHDRGTHRGPEHATCNRAAAGRDSHT